MRNFNSEVTRELVRAGKLQGESTDKILDTIQPTLELNPRITRRCEIVRGASRTTSGTSTIYTTPSDTDFYLTGISLNAAADVASDTVNFYASIVILGATRVIIELRKITLTAYAGSSCFTFPFPIKVDRNSSITFTINSTVGSSSLACSIVGYVDEGSK
jgi:hypothetical protein